MEYERKLETVKAGEREEYLYYVKKKPNSFFGCVMYNVGIVKGKRKKEIDDFSPSLDEAKKLCNYLYEENVTPNNLFVVAEEFIVTL